MLHGSSASRASIPRGSGATIKENAGDPAADRSASVEDDVEARDLRVWLELRRRRGYGIGKHANQAPDTGRGDLIVQPKFPIGTDEEALEAWFEEEVVRRGLVQGRRPTQAAPQRPHPGSVLNWAMLAIKDGKKAPVPKEVAYAIEALENLIRGLQEKNADFGADSASCVRTAFQGLDLHPRIAEASAELYRNGHYRNAVLDASLALEDYVKQKSRCRDRDGANLMRYVFSRNSPVLAFNDLTDDTAWSEQEGVMHLFEGVILALRNPRAHTLVDDAPEEALEYIALLSLLAKRLEKSQRVRDP